MPSFLFSFDVFMHFDLSAHCSILKLKESGRGELMGGGEIVLGPEWSEFFFFFGYIQYLGAFMLQLT